MNKRVSIIRVIAGGYLVYLGLNLFRGMQMERPENYMLLTAASIVFVVLGALFVITGLRPMLKKEEQTEEVNDVSEEPLEAESENPVSDQSESVPDSEETKPKRPKSLRERAMLASQDTDVDIASEDIIAATEEIISTEESEYAIASINSDDLAGQPIENYNCSRCGGSGIRERGSTTICAYCRSAVN